MKKGSNTQSPVKKLQKLFNLKKTLQKKRKRISIHILVPPGLILTWFHMPLAFQLTNSGIDVKFRPAEQSVERTGFPCGELCPPEYPPHHQHRILPFEGRMVNLIEEAVDMPVEVLHLSTACKEVFSPWYVGELVTYHPDCVG